jgi:hypothetical protein
MGAERLRYAEHPARVVRTLRKYGYTAAAQGHMLFTDAPGSVVQNADHGVLGHKKKRSKKSPKKRKKTRSRK